MLYAECLSVIMLSVIQLIVIILNVVMLIVVAPLVYHDGLPVSDEFRNLVTVAGTTLAKCFKTFLRL